MTKSGVDHCFRMKSAGFSAEEPESGDEGAFLTDHTVKVSEAHQNSAQIDPF